MENSSVDTVVLGTNQRIRRHTCDVDRFRADLNQMAHPDAGVGPREIEFRTIKGCEGCEVPEP